MTQRFIQKLDRWHQTRQGLFVFGIAELGLAYLFGSLAVNSGSLWQYVLTLLFLIGSMRNIFLFIKPRKHDNKK